MVGLKETALSHLSEIALKASSLGSKYWEITQLDDKGFSYHSWSVFEGSINEGHDGSFKVNVIFIDPCAPVQVID